MLTEADLSYLAGVLDTRAVVRTRLVSGNATQTVLPMIAMSCGDAALLHWLADITDVRSIITTRTYDKHRCLEHCTKAHDHIESVSGRWSVTGAKATVVLSATLPYVRFHEAEWQRGLAVGIGANKKPATVQKMAGLGWPMPVAWTLL
jgi:hypothetical protein